MNAELALPLVGVDVGGTHLRTGVFVGRDLVWEERRAAHLSRHCRADAPEASLAFVVDTLATAIETALDARPDVAGVGLAVPAFLDAASGRIARSPNLPGIVDVDLVSPLEDRLGRSVVLENDALAAAWGEYVLCDPPPSSLLYVGLGTGVGGGLVLAGRPWRGAHGFAMEVGHVIVEPGGRPCGCGNRGCLESYASALGVCETLRQATGDVLEAHEVAERARGGGTEARAAFARAGSELASVVAHLLTVLDVPDVVVGGGLAASWDLMAPAFDERLDRDLLPVHRGRARVRTSTAGDRAGMLGVARLSAPGRDEGEGHGPS